MDWCSEFAPPIAYARMISIVGAAGDRDPRAFGNEHGLVRALPRRDKIAGIDHRGCHGLAVDQRTAARSPGAVGVKLELIDTGVAKEFHSVAAFDEARAFAQQALQFHRTNLGTVLLGDRAALRNLVVVEQAFEPLAGRSEEHTSETQSLM